MTNSTYQFPYVDGISPALSDLAYWADIMFDPDDSSPTYIGLNLINGSSTSTIDWKIYKFTYTSSGATTRIQLAYGAWDNRAILF